MFEISIGLTEKGEQNYMEVIEYVYQFINKIKEEGPQDYVFEEKKVKSKIDFDNIVKTSPMQYGNMLARRLSSYDKSADINLILKAPYLMEKIDKDDIMAKLALFRPDNMFIVFVSTLLKKELEANPDKFKVEYFYKKQFTIEQISDEQAKKLENAKFTPNQKEEDGTILRMGHPPPNEFMPTLEGIKSMKASRINPDKPNVPAQI